MSKQFTLADIHIAMEVARRTENAEVELRGALNQFNTEDQRAIYVNPKREHFPTRGAYSRLIEAYDTLAYELRAKGRFYKDRDLESYAVGYFDRAEYLAKMRTEYLEEARRLL